MDTYEATELFNQEHDKVVKLQAEKEVLEINRAVSTQEYRDLKAENKRLQKELDYLGKVSSQQQAQKGNKE